MISSHFIVFAQIIRQAIAEISSAI